MWSSTLWLGYCDLPQAFQSGYLLSLVTRLLISSMVWYNIVISCRRFFFQIEVAPLQVYQLLISGPYWRLTLFSLCLQVSQKLFFLVLCYFSLCSKSLSLSSIQFNLFNVVTSICQISINKYRYKQNTLKHVLL